MQDYLVHIIFGAAVVYLALWFRRQMRVKNAKDTCGHCDDGCSTAKPKDASGSTR